MLYSFAKDLDTRYVVCVDDYHEGKGIIYLPAYMAHLI